MSDLLILGTDTDVGKTTFALLWMAGFSHRFEYWKPVETGTSDSDMVRHLIPGATVHPPCCRFADPVAPLLAARHAGVTIPPAKILAMSRPVLGQGKQLLMETFGGPLSPLNENELQIELIRLLQAPTLLVCSSRVGAVGRSLQCLAALRSFQINHRALVLLGPRDDFALEQISRVHPDLAVMAVGNPVSWGPEDIGVCARDQHLTLEKIARLFGPDEGAGFFSTQETLDLQHRDRCSLWHPYTSLRDPDPPLVCAGADNEFLQLADGRRVIDGISSWWTILHGHNWPPLRQALQEAPIDHVHFAGVTHRPAVELAELLLASSPWPPSSTGAAKGGRVFFSDNGSTAVEVALKLAYQFWCHQGQPQRTRFVGFEHGYHGDTFGAMAVSRDPVFFGRFEPLLFQADIVPLSPQHVEEVLAKNRGKTAAVIIEPLVQGAGGMRMHAPQTLQQIFEIARKHEVLFIADEVMTGGGRTGTLWAYQAAGIAPDLICAAKTLTGGILPLAATLVAPHLVQAWDTPDRTKTFYHGHSFTANPLACAVAVANWKLLMKSFPETPRKMEAFWNQELASLRDHPRVREVRVKGSIAAVELDVPGGYLADVGRHLRQACLDRQVLLRPLGNVLYSLPPYCTSLASLHKIKDAMCEAVQSLPANI